MIDLGVELKKYNIEPKGIIHVGGHKAQEYESYCEIGLLNQIWIEANPYFFEEINHKIGNDKNCVSFNEAIYDSEKELSFNLSNNGASSSLLPLKLHKKYYPNIRYDGHLIVKTKRLDTLLNENDISIEKYNGLALDIQGVELNALKSLGEYIENFDFILTEINVEELYEGCCLIGDLDSYLSNNGFCRVVTDLWDGGSVGWGDALYLKTQKHD